MMKSNNSRSFFVYYAGWGMQCCGEPILTLTRIVHEGG